MCEHCDYSTAKGLIDGGTSDWPDPELEGIKDKMRDTAQTTHWDPADLRDPDSELSGMTVTVHCRVHCNPDTINKTHFIAPTTTRGRMLMSYLRMLDQYHSPE